MRPVFGASFFMNKTVRVGIFLLVCSISGFLGRATSFLPATTDQQTRVSSAIFRGMVLNTQSYEDPADGQLYTRTAIRVDEVFKGNLPSIVKLVHRGGAVAGKGELDGFAPQFKAGEERLVLVSRRADGTLYATRGNASALRLAAGASPDYAAGQALLKELRSQTVSGPLSGDDVTDQAAGSQDLTTQAYPKGVTPMTTPSSSATNLTAGSDGIPARFLLPDRGEPIPYEQ
jgi:hypothetical protein